jgi:predicted NAD/FAD-binding protein
MSFSVSLGDGAFEYGGNSLASLFAQKKNLLRPRFWSMLAGIVRFYRRAPHDLPLLSVSGMTLGDYLSHGKYGTAFARDHLLPMAGAIWSAPPRALLDYPAAAFIRFFTLASMIFGPTLTSPHLAVSETEKRMPLIPASFIRSTISFNSCKHSK